jgi:hypothetical protein
VVLDFREAAAMPRDNAKMQQQITKIHAQFDHHEKATRWILTFVAILTMLALVYVIGQLLQPRAPL